MALKSSNLTQTNTYEVEVEVDGKTFMEAVAKVFKKQAKKITVPGFRNGKAPRAIIEEIYGEDVFYDDAMQDCDDDSPLFIGSVISVILILTPPTLYHSNI
ncbi:MAG: trigger factor family protein [Ruminococcus sp.]|nr:trigger factor family protein [Ruminococcus sp.]